MRAICKFVGRSDFGLTWMLIHLVRETYNYEILLAWHKGSSQMMFEIFIHVLVYNFLHVLNVLCLKSTAVLS